MATKDINRSHRSMLLSAAREENVDKLEDERGVKVKAASVRERERDGQKRASQLRPSTARPATFPFTPSFVKFLSSQPFSFEGPFAKKAARERASELAC